MVEELNATKRVRIKGYASGLEDRQHFIFIVSDKNTHVTVKGEASKIKALATSLEKTKTVCLDALTAQGFKFSISSLVS